MRNRLKWNEGNVLRATRGVVLLAGMIAIGGFADAQQGSMPDAQVEANVLRALSSAPELATESITTHTVYGVVTLSGSVKNDSARRKAENLAANANGVQKVIDELSVGAATSAPANETAGLQQPAQRPVQQSSPMGQGPPAPCAAVRRQLCASDFGEHCGDAGTRQRDASGIRSSRERQAQRSGA